MSEFEPCPFCKKLNSTKLRNCAWCYAKIPTRAERVMQWVIGGFSVLVTAAIAWMFL